MDTPTANNDSEEPEPDYILDIGETDIQDFLEVEIESTCGTGQEISTTTTTTTQYSPISSPTTPVNSPATSPRSGRSPSSRTTASSSSSSSSSDCDEDSCASLLAPPCSPLTPRPGDQDAEITQSVSVIQWIGRSPKKQRSSDNEEEHKSTILTQHSYRPKDSTLSALKMLLEERNARFGGGGDNHNNQSMSMTLYRASSPVQFQSMRNESGVTTVAVMNPNPDPPPAYNPNLQVCNDINCPYVYGRPGLPPPPPSTPEVQIVEEIRRSFPREVRPIPSEMMENGVTFFGPPGGTGGLRKRTAAHLNTYQQPMQVPPGGQPHIQQHTQSGHTGIVANQPFRDPYGCQYRTYRCSCCQLILGYHRQVPGGESPPVESPKFRCTVCGRCYFTEIQLKRHGRRHDEKRYTCQHCRKRFHTRGEARAHSVVHTGEKPFMCSICLHTYSYASTFFAHLQIRHRTSFDTCAQCQ